uniref:Uncharacterized protein n=1 Tax=Panagrolaimus sp. PS1159 TaxID=55785 RepID=A0AC35FXE8_9BILA
MDSASLSSDSSRNVAVGTDGVSHGFSLSFDSGRNASVGIDGDSLSAKNVNGLRAPSVANTVGSPRTENNICDENVEGLRAPRTENNVESSRAGNIIFGDGIEIETVRDEINVEQQIPENSGAAEPEFMEVVVDKVIDVDE